MLPLDRETLLLGAAIGAVQNLQNKEQTVEEMNENTKLGCSQTIIWGRCSVGALREHPTESGGPHQCLKLAVRCLRISS